MIQMAIIKQSETFKTDLRPLELRVVVKVKSILFSTRSM